MNKERVKIHIEETGQDTTAQLICKGMIGSNYCVAILCDIQDLKEFPMLSKVKFLGQEEWFHYNPGKKILVSRDIKPIDEWFNRKIKESEEKKMTRNVTITKTENKIIEEYWLMRGIRENKNTHVKSVIAEREFEYKPSLQEIAQFLSDSKADFASVEHNYRFEPDLPFC